MMMGVASSAVAGSEIEFVGLEPVVEQHGRALDTVSAYAHNDTLRAGFGVGLVVAVVAVELVGSAPAGSVVAGVDAVVDPASASAAAGTVEAEADVTPVPALELEPA